MNVFEAAPIARCSSFHDTDLYDADSRLAQLVVLLRQLETVLGGMAVVPEREVSEIISGALGVCGFIEPVEAYRAMAIVLDVLERQYPKPDG